MPPASRRAARLVAAAGLSVLLAACHGVVSTPPSPTATGRPPLLSLDPLDAEPRERQEESIGFAFDGAEAEALLESVPDDLDLATHAVVCVFLGPRQTTGWRLDLGSVRLGDGELLVLARESPPRGTTRPEVTYPADCGILNRDALPVGRLVVRAEDTITDEFITDATIEVPEPLTAP